MADGGGEEGNASAHKGSARRRGAVQAGLDADELLTLMHGSDPVKVELTRLENEVRGELIRDPCCVDSIFGGFLSLLRILLGNAWCFYGVADKDRELGEAHAEIKALRLSERAREKAVEEVSSQCSSCLCKTVVCMLISLCLGVGVVSAREIFSAKFGRSPSRILRLRWFTGFSRNLRVFELSELVFVSGSIFQLD